MLLPKLPEIYMRDIVRRALEEDINYVDVTTDFLFDEKHKSRCKLIAKEDGIIAGLDFLAEVFLTNQSWVCVDNDLVKDGDCVNRGDIIAQVSGATSAILKAERTALNFLQHMSGIATYTRQCVDAVKGTNAVIADTRKTLPGLRALQKYAVLCGGGVNHRYNLSQAAMLKDNHIAACCGIAAAVETLRKRVGHTIMIEVEIRNMNELTEAIGAGANIVMLDNMSVPQMREAVEFASGRAKLEASGNITIENIREVAETGVDIISLGALTHSVKALDISLLF
jgi:nicotinate-nucleotide pyrophosphorylase (carboxylating)